MNQKYNQHKPNHNKHKAHIEWKVKIINLLFIIFILFIIIIGFSYWSIRIERKDKIKELEQNKLIEEKGVTIEIFDEVPEEINENIEDTPKPKRRLTDLMPMTQDCGNLDLTAHIPEDYTPYNCYCENLFQCNKVTSDMFITEDAFMTYTLQGIQSNGLCKVMISTPTENSYLDFPEKEMTCEGEIFPSSQAPIDYECKLVLEIFANGFLDIAKNASDQRCDGELRDLLISG